MSLVVISTHPIQYHAPVYRMLQAKFNIPVTVIYGSDFSVVGYKDKEFQTKFAWDTDLLGGYTSVFLSRVSTGGARTAEKVSTLGLKNSLEQTRPKAILLLGYGQWFHQVAFWYATRVKCPIFFRGETTDHAKTRNIVKSLARDYILRLVYNRCSKLLYIGQRSYQHFKRLRCDSDKMILSPYCVDIKPFQCDEAGRNRLRPMIRQKYKIRDEEQVLLFSGKLIKRKGLKLLLDAAKMLPAELRKNIVVMFMGSGELQNHLEKIAREEPVVKAHFLGFKNQNELSQYYNAADLLVLPSLHSETWGLVVNEALHHGLPCVVSEAVGCAPDLIESGVTGEVFKTGSATDLALAIQRSYKLIGQPEVRKWCREKVGGYTVDKAAEGIAKAYFDCVKS